MPAYFAWVIRSFARRTDSSRSGSADLLRREPSREIGAHIVKRFAQTATLPFEGAPWPGACLAWRASSNFAYFRAKCSPPAAQTGSDLTGFGPKISSVVEAQGPLERIDAA